MQFQNDQNLYNTVLAAPVGICILDAATLTIEIVNDKFLEVAGKPQAAITGKFYWDVFTGTRAQHQAELQKVVETGVPYQANGQERIFVTLFYSPVKDAAGKVVKVAVWVLENTEMASVNEEIAASNEELTVTNEELSEAQGQLQAMIDQLGKTNDDLQLTNQQVNKLNLRLTESETDFKRMVEQAPVAILVFRGPELVVDLANSSILEILGKDSSIIGQPLLEAMPELKGEPAVELLFDIYHKGISSDGNEVPVRMQRNGQTETRYFNFSYRPLKDGEQIIGVMDVAVEVTGQVLARQAIEWAEEQLRLAIDSAELATWHLDAGTGEFFPSVRLKELFGYGADEEMPLAAGIDQITDPYREMVRNAVENTINTGAVYDVEYQVEGFHDKKIRWLRARGRLYKSIEHKDGNFFGVISDITESKLLEQRKDDFLSIASHELKTPLTSLKSTLQILDRMKQEFTAPIHVKLLEQANRSMEKIGNLVDDLLQVNRLDIGQLALHKSTFTVADMLNKCCNHIRAGGKHELILQGDEQLAIYADENRIDQVIVNLVNNAVKYAPGSKEIYLIVEQIPGFAKISVKDTGPGITADKIPFLFNRYYRAEHASKVYSGLGLGLYICAEIIKRHNGEIGVDTTPGVGSTFWFTLPIGTI